MATYTPSLSELDSHQGDAALAIGGGGSMAGNLPLKELFDENTINSLSKITDNYVARKNQEYDDFMKKVALTKQNASKTAGIMAADIPAIKKMQREHYAIVEKKPYLFTADAPIKYAKEYQEFLDSEEKLLSAIDLSKSHNVLDKEYRKELTDPKKKNALNEKRVNDFRTKPIEERVPLLLMSNPTNDINSVTKNLSKFKVMGDPKVNPLSTEGGEKTGLFSIDQDFTINKETLLADLVEYGDLYGAEYDELLSETEKKELAGIGIDKQKWIENKLLQGVPMEGQEKTQIRTDIPFGQDFRTVSQEAGFANQEKERIAREAEAERVRREKEAQDRADRVKDPKYAFVRKVIADTNIFDTPSNGKQVVMPDYAKVEGTVYDITEQVNSKPLLAEWAKNKTIYAQTTPSGTKYYKRGASDNDFGKLLKKPISKETIIGEVFDLQDGNQRKDYAEYLEILNGASAKTPIGNYPQDFEGVDPKDIPISKNKKAPKRKVVINADGTTTFE